MTEVAPQALRLGEEEDRAPLRRAVRKRLHNAVLDHQTPGEVPLNPRSRHPRVKAPRAPGTKRGHL